MSGWNIRSILDWTTGYFTDKGIASARIDAEVLLAYTLKVERIYLYTHYDRPVNQEERTEYRKLIMRRARHEPVAYITGHKEFMSLQFMVTPDVLIPRPDTEILVEKVIELAGKEPKPKICDVGTGSGAIAVSLAKYIPDSIVYASDIFPEVIEVARQNAANNEVTVQFRRGNLCKAVIDEAPFDYITANLPYISKEEYKELESDVKDYEPRQALLAPGDGLDIYRDMLPQAWQLLKQGAYILLEIGYMQGAAALKLIEPYPGGEAEILKDLGGRDRVLVIRKE